MVNCKNDTECWKTKCSKAVVPDDGDHTDVCPIDPLYPGILENLPKFDGLNGAEQQKKKRANNTCITFDAVNTINGATPSADAWDCYDRYRTQASQPGRNEERAAVAEMFCASDKGFNSWQCRCINRGPGGYQKLQTPRGPQYFDLFSPAKDALPEKFRESQPEWCWYDKCSAGTDDHYLKPANFPADLPCNTVCQNIITVGSDAQIGTIDAINKCPTGGPAAPKGPSDAPDDRGSPLVLGISIVTVVISLVALYSARS